MKGEAISVKNLSYTYPDGTEALREIDMEVEDGERVAIVGPNGAGKTTLLLHLNRVLEADSGRVDIFGENVEDMEREEVIKKVGVVFQDPDDQLFMPTVFDEVAFGPINLGLPEEEVRRRVKNALGEVGLSGYEERSPHNLSFGEKKKACLAAVLSMKPKILVLDEPTADLDPRSRRELIGRIRRLEGEGEGEMTTVVATHDIDSVPEIADRVYVLNGRVIAGSTPRGVFSDDELLRENNLDVPEVFKLFKVLECFGLNCENLPLSIDEAIDELTETMDTEGGHVHLHIHEHTHEDIERVRGKYEHH